MSQLETAIVASLVTIAANWLITVLVSREKIKAVKGVLLQEIEVCADMAKTFTAPDPKYGVRVMAPLYRLPTSAFSTGLKEIMGSISEADAQALIRFYAQVETLNRGLDLADLVTLQAPGTARGVTPAEIDERNRLKAQTIRVPNGHLYLTAARAVT